ncbi:MULTISPECIES: hypothetical protein [Clostridium]|uniref:Uncharacterized protein n=1 Tax=Clostridium faecium TaxID=2762223 RepID=A0ABR8YVV8_9CLOT|nr:MULTISPECIES: hypothetical protein [Clostridium]MBD8048426.1 hypothetical protein [Clostridium faecium]MDU1351003.1 hypothetical protein [Clostridium argentinense]
MSKIKDKIENYNSKIYSLSKPKYILLLIFTSLLQTLALTALVAAIDNRFENILKKFIIILIVFLIINLGFRLKSYKKYH